MAIGILFLMFVVMGIISIVGSVLLFILKGEKANNILLVLMTAYSIIIAFISSTAQPSNYVSQQIISWIIAFVAVAGTAYKFITKKQSVISNLMVAASVLGGIGYLFLF